MDEVKVPTEIVDDVIVVTNTLTAYVQGDVAKYVNGKAIPKDKVLPYAISKVKTILKSDALKDDDVMSEVKSLIAQGIKYIHVVNTPQDNRKRELLKSDLYIKTLR